MISDYNKNGNNSRNRLNDISHHFFGDSSESSPSAPHSSKSSNSPVASKDANDESNYSTRKAARQAKRIRRAARPITFLPVLLASQNQDSCVFGINDTFNAKLKSCLVVNVDSALNKNLPVDLSLSGSYLDLGSPSDNEGASTRANNQAVDKTNQTNNNRIKIINHLSELELKPDICLLPFVSHKLSLVNEGDFLLVVVPASFAGVRSLFHSLEKICDNMNSMHIGVIVIDACSMQMSQLCYDVIANSIRSFLGLKSMILGHLLSESAIDLNTNRAIQFADESNTLTNSAPIELEDIADKVWDVFIKLLSDNRSMNILSQSRASGATQSGQAQSRYVNALV